MEFRQLALDGVVEILPRRFEDDRGFFCETFNTHETGRVMGPHEVFVQDNHSLSVQVGTLRGLHFQLPPCAQAKLVRVVHGAIYDVVVDIRKGSPDFGRWAGLHISAEKWNQIYVPKGFAHGFVTLEPDTQVIYKVTDFYSPDHERSIRFDDPAIAIRWPLAAASFILSGKDRNAPLLDDVDTGFVFSQFPAPRHRSTPSARQ